VADGGRLAGRAAIVTGGAAGIGRGIAARFAREGALVVVADVDREAGERVAAEISAAGGTACAIACDVAQSDEVEALVAATAARYGGPHILVNNAGIALLYEPFFTITRESWQRVIDVNLTGAFLCAQAAARRMRDYGGGCIINITSVNAYRPETDVAHYAASKGGLRLLTMSMARDLAPFGISVNAIAPGAVRTERTSAWDREHPHEAGETMARLLVPRRGEPDEIAAAAVFLASDEGHYIRGQTLVVDGGYLLV
jgi:NAD(P)-dependent dehydrogenase (short-subunit alcohol dehydrogenase family)